MKKLYTSLFLLLFSCALCKAQWVTIPDANFVSYLQTKFPSCMNGSQLDTASSIVKGVDSINCISSGIHNLYGIQFFSNLKILICGSNPLDSLPHIPFSLHQLNCSYGLTYGILPALPAGLDTLECINCSITSLPPLPASLTYLDCAQNGLTHLPDLPASLLYLYCYYNSLV